MKMSFPVMMNDDEVVGFDRRVFGEFPYKIRGFEEFGADRAANLAEMTHNPLRAQKHIKRGKNQVDHHSHRLESL
jgi:hypothetical protein